ncbi:hypothetical protein E8E13_006712 [Curvularia kusanoi]|uniref:LysM domain-containing protein n=1 Tax=Curvularia kusanoi TaxID=90978 RepID=A0A9P4WBW5_CURKU|nr:hypothetical protein E8E13_006712 [Curvularia kusanoi]
MKAVLLLLSAMVSMAAATPVFPHVQLEQRAGSTVTIKAGDTLSTIAASTGVGICDIAKANNIKDPNVIQAGATLKIPAATGKKDNTSCVKKA